MDNKEHCNFKFEKVKDIATIVRDYSMFGDNSPISNDLIKYA
jgi:hypothetical protein